MLHGLLVILLFFFVLIAVMAMIAVWMVFRCVGHLRDKVFKSMGFDGFSSGGRASSSSRTGSGRRQQSDDGTIIIDNRDPEQARRKIIPHDEGEYVDFEEEK